MNKVKSVLVLAMIIVCVIGLTISRNKNLNDEILNQTTGLETKVVLYFSNPENGELTKEYRNVELSSIKNDLAGTIINELLKGPNTEGLVSPIPTGTKVNSCKEENDKIKIDFSSEYKTGEQNELEELHKIYSVVNSLTEITEINEVEITVDGNALTSKIRL